MASEYQVNAKIHLTPVWHADPPRGKLSTNDSVIDFVLTEPQEFELNFNANDNGFIRVEFLNKIDADTIVDQGLDKAIIVDWISFFNISDPKFVWEGVYTPIYPEPWYSQAVEKPAKSLKNSNYLGWNGTWQLDFTVPVFSWIHRMQSHGWLYD